MKDIRHQNKPFKLNNTKQPDLERARDLPRPLTKEDVQTAGKHMHRRATSYVNRDTQVKITAHPPEGPQSRALPTPNGHVHSGKGIRNIRLSGWVPGVEETNRRTLRIFKRVKIPCIMYNDEYMS